MADECKKKCKKANLFQVGWNPDGDESDDAEDLNKIWEEFDKLTRE